MSIVKKIKFELSFIEDVASACENGDVEFLKNLENEAIIFAHYKTFFDAGCKGGSVEVLKILKGTFNVLRLKELGLSLLPIAIKHGHLELVKFLLDEGETDELAVSIAVMAGHYEIVEFLLVRGFDVNKKDPERRFRTPLAFAVMKPRLDFAKLLIARGANPNLADSQHETPLFDAFRNIEMMTFLLESGANPNAVNKFGLSVLHQVETIEQASVLLKAGCNPKVLDKFEFSPLHTAIQKGHFDLAKFFITQGMCSRQKARNKVSALTLTMDLFQNRPQNPSDFFEFLLGLKDDKDELSYLWNSFGRNREKLAPIFFKKRIPFPKKFDPKIAKPILKRHFNSETTNTLFCARKSPGNPFFEDDLPLDIFKIILPLSKKGSFKAVWDRFLA